MITVIILISLLSLAANLREEFFLQKTKSWITLNMLRLRSLSVFSLTAYIIVSQNFSDTLIISLGTAAMANLAVSLAITASVIRLIYLDIICERLKAAAEQRHAPKYYMPKTLPLIEPGFKDYFDSIPELRQLDQKTRDMVVTGNF